MRRTEIPWVDVADATRREIVNDLFVERESFEPIAATMNRLREDHREGKETSCMSIVGVPGVGKSQLLKRYAAANGMITETTSDGISRRLPVLYAELDSNITVNDAAETILRALLGKRAPGGSTIKNRVLPDQLEIWRVELLIIDEFQHVGERGRSKTRNATADWIKSIAKKLRIPVVMAGMEVVAQLIEDNEQLSSITPYRFTMPRYDFDEPEDRAAFAELLKGLDAALPFDASSDLGDVSTSNALLRASCGYLRDLSRIVATAARLAIADSSCAISIDHLRQACDEDMHLDCLSNPFDDPFADAA